MPLTDTAIRNAKPGLSKSGSITTKPYKMGDTGGLYLEVAPTGGKWWRFKYRFDGKEKRMSLGVYPDVSLKDARQRRDEARRLVAAGVDPGKNRKAQKLTRSDQGANSFEVVAREWFAKYKPSWTDGHSVAAWFISPASTQDNLWRMTGERSDCATEWWKAGR